MLCLAGAVILPLAVPLFCLAQGPPELSLIGERPEADLLLLALRLGRTILAETLPAYQKSGDVLVPLGEVSRLLGFGIDVDVATGRAAGFVIGEGRLFDLDIASRQVHVEGKRRRFDPAGIEVHRDDIYVGAALLSEWLPLRLDVDLFASSITVRPLEPLPLQLRLEREQRIGLSRASQDQPASRLPRFELPYRLLGGPFVDLTLGYAWRRQSGEASKDKLQYSSYITGDLLWMEANAYVAGNEEGLDEARLSLGRKDPGGRLLGVLGAREVTVGDVLAPGLDLIAGSRSGVGLLVSNSPLNAPSQFDRQTFRGALAPGWDVELYRNEALMAYAQSRSDGLYEFPDVPLLFGMNLFRLEFYGPQGQRRTEPRIFNVSQTLTPPGQLTYRLAGNDPGARLAGTGPSGAEPRATLDVSFGLTKYLSVSAGVATLGLKDGRHEYSKAGLRGYWGRVFANADFSADTGGDTAWQGTVQSRVGAFGLQLQHAELDGFVSELFPDTVDPLRRRTSLRIDTAIPPAFLPRIPLLFEAKQDLFASGLRISEISGRLSAFYRGLSVSNQTSWMLVGADADRATAEGLLLVSKTLRSFSLRGEVGYKIQPEADVTSLALTAETRVLRFLQLSAGVNRTLTSNRTSYFVGASNLEGAFGWTAKVDASDTGSAGASVSLSLGLGRDARDGRWRTQARGMAGAGGASAQAFLDANGNGVLDGGEAPLGAVGFKVSGSGNRAHTDASGVAFLANLTPHQELGLSVDTSTLEDPFWKPAREGVRLTPRPGTVAVVGFPVVVAGEITGTVYLLSDGQRREMSGVELQLVDRKGNIVAITRSAYDGFYDLTDIRPGDYTLRVSPEHVARLRLHRPPTRSLGMVPTGTVFDGFDLVLDAEGALQGTAAVDAAPGRAVSASASSHPPATQMRPAPEKPVPAPAATAPEPASTRPPAVVPSAPTAAATGRRPGQVASYPTRAAADADARDRVRRLGQRASVMAVDLKAKGIWYRVYVDGREDRAAPAPGR